MTKAQEFTTKVQSEDPKKKEKPESDKPDFEGSKFFIDGKKDAKEGEEGEELVRYFLELESSYH
jgi:26S proteasome regulatory subunit N1